MWNVLICFEKRYYLEVEQSSDLVPKRDLNLKMTKVLCDP